MSAPAYDPRDLEWQRRYEAGDTPWDKSAPAPPLADYLVKEALPGRVLVPGCGRGHEVRLLAARPETTALGLDLSAAAVAQAREIAAHEQPPSRAEFRAGDFFALPPELRGTFDWIVEHTCFCAIDPTQRPAYVRAVAEALRPGGKIFAIFYLVPEREVGPPFPVDIPELDRLFSPAFTVQREWVPENAFPGREGQERVRILQKRPEPAA
jgi:SAM-dependent methyltransferase